MTKSARIAAQIKTPEDEMISALNREYPELHATRGDWNFYCNNEHTLWKHDQLRKAYDVAVKEEQH